MGRLSRYGEIAFQQAIGTTPTMFVLDVLQAVLWGRVQAVEPPYHYCRSPCLAWPEDLAYRNAMNSRAACGWLFARHQMTHSAKATIIAKNGQHGQRITMKHQITAQYS